MTVDEIHALVRKLALSAAAPGLLLLTNCCFGGTGNCGRDFVTFPPELKQADSGFVLDGGTPSSSECLLYCDGGASFCMPATDAGPNAVDCIIRCVGGRAPPGLLSLAAAGEGAAGWLARS